MVGGGRSDGAELPCSRHHGGRGSCCHCQILSRAVGCKQQMVELVPEQRVKPRQPAVWLAGLFHEITSAPRWAQVFSEGLAVFVFALRLLCLVAELCVASSVLSNKAGALGAALRLYCAYSLCSIRGSYRHQSAKVFTSLRCH